MIDATREALDFRIVEQAGFQVGLPVDRGDCASVSCEIERRARSLIARHQNARVRRRMNLARYRTVGAQAPMLGPHEFLPLFLPLELVLSPGCVGRKPLPLA